MRHRLLSRLKVALDPRLAAVIFTLLIVTVAATEKLAVRRAAAFGAMGLVVYGIVVAIPYFVAEGLRWRQARRRERLGLCVECGYDLRGNESGVCPECGRPTI
jgi:hypothetical protein